MLTYTEAIDAMNTLFRTGWLAKSAAIVGYVPEVRWMGVEESAQPSQAVYWARVGFNAVNTEQSTIGGTGEDFARRWETSGLFWVQLFGPETDPAGADKLRRLGMLAQASIRGQRSDSLWFRTVTLRELPNEAAMRRVNVIAQAEFVECSSALA